MQHPLQAVFDNNLIQFQNHVVKIQHQNNLKLNRFYQLLFLWYETHLIGSGHGHLQHLRSSLYIDILNTWGHKSNTMDFCFLEIMILLYFLYFWHLPRRFFNKIGGEQADELLDGMLSLPIVICYRLGAVAIPTFKTSLLRSKFVCACDFTVLLPFKSEYSSAILAVHIETWYLPRQILHIYPTTSNKN